MVDHCMYIQNSLFFLAVYSAPSSGADRALHSWVKGSSISVKSLSTGHTGAFDPKRPQHSKQLSQIRARSSPALLSKRGSWHALRDLGQYHQRSLTCQGLTELGVLGSLIHADI
jgi:hypothetical protein